MKQSSNIIEHELDPENPKYQELLNKLDLEDDPDYGVYLELNIGFNYYYSPMRRNYGGLPEPSEFDYEITSIECLDSGIELSNLLSDKEVSKIEELSIEKLEIY